MRRVEAAPSARIPTSGTPTRTRHESAIVPPNILTHRPHKESSLEPKLVDGRSLSPNKLQATKKPMISPKTTVTTGGQNHFRNRKVACPNHHDREPEFRITINSETILYCERCAAHLASQGFKVERIQQSKYRERKNISMGSTGQFQGHPRAAEIADFLENLRLVDRCMRDNNRSLMDIQSHYT